MAENAPAPAHLVPEDTENQETEKKPNFINRLIAKYPRTAKAAGFTAAAVAVVGVAAAVKQSMDKDTNSTTLELESNGSSEQEHNDSPSETLTVVTEA